MKENTQLTLEFKMISGKKVTADFTGGDGHGTGILWLNGDGGSNGPHREGHNILFADGHVQWFVRWDSNLMTRWPH